MELVKYLNLNEFFQDISPFIESNFISHFQLFETIDRLANRDEEIINLWNVKNGLEIEIIYLHTNRGHYFYGTTINKLAVKKLSDSIQTNNFVKDTILYGYSFIIENLIKEKKLKCNNNRNRYYMSINSCNININKVDGKIYEAKEQDYNLLLPLMIDFYQEEFEDKGIQTIEKVSLNFKKSLQTNGIYYWKIENQITSLISTTILPCSKVYIPNIYTIPKFRLKGISKTVLGSLLNIFFDKGFIEVGLNVRINNEPAIGLFNSLGMKIIYETGIYEL